jgi:DHA2 family multidrug resistance protein
VSGVVNTLRAFGSLLGAGLVGQLVTVRGRFHADALLDHAGLVLNSLALAPEPFQLAGIVGQQAQVLSVADAYRALGVLALLLIPLALRLTHIPAPSSTPPSTHE